MAKVRVEIEVADTEAVGKVKNFGRAVQDAWGQVKAGDPALRSATVRVQELTTAKGKAATVTNQWTGALTLLPGPLGQVASQASSLAGILSGPGGLIVGMAAVAAAGVGLVRSLANDIERLDNLSRTTGLSVAALQAFEQAAKEAGESPDTLVQGLGRVNQAINDVLTGASNAGKAFKDIGVDLRGLVERGASAEDVLEATAKALKAIPDPTQRAAQAWELLGLRGRGFETVLNTIATTGIPAYVQAMREAGVVTSEETNRMATDLDKMADEYDRLWTGLVKRAKAAAAEIVMTLRRSADPSAVFGVMPGDIEGPAAIERPPPQDVGRRTLAPTAEDKAAAKAAADFRLKLARDTGQEILKEYEATARESARIDAAAMDMRQQAEEATRKNIAAIYIQAVDDYEQRQEALQAADTATRQQRLAGEVETARQMQTLQTEVQQAVATEQARALQEQLAFVASTSTGRIQRLEAEREVVRKLLDDGVLDVQATEDAKLRILELTVARDIELEQRAVDRSLEFRIAAQNQMNAILATRVTAEQRAAEAILQGQVLAAQGSGNAWGAFSAAFQLEVTTWGTAMQGFATLGAQTAQTMSKALSEGFFDLVTGQVKSLADVWQNFWQSMVRMITDFLASAAVAALLKWVTGISAGSGFSINLSGGGGGGAGGGVASTAQSIATSTALKGLWNYITTGSVLGAAGAGSAGLGSSVAASGVAAEAAAAAAEASAAAAEASAAATATTATTTAGISAIGVVAAVAIPVAIFAFGALTAAANHATREQRVLLQDVHTMERLRRDMVAGALGPLDLGYAATTAASIAKAGPKGLGKLGLDPAMAQQLLAENARAISEAFRQQMQSILAGQKIAPLGQQFQLDTKNDVMVETTSGFQNQSRVILESLQGFKGLSKEIQMNFINLMTSFQGASAPITEMVQNLSETLPGGLKLSNEQATQLVDHVLSLTPATEAALAATGELMAAVLDTTNGIGDAATEAGILANAMVAGIVPADSMQSIFQVLATEHGPAFVKTVEDLLLQLGLSKTQAAELLGTVQKMAEGVTVPIVYDISWKGSPPPGAAPGGFDGGWVAGFAPGGWVTGGVRDRDSVLARLARGEFVVNNRVASRPGMPSFLGDLNRRGAAAIADRVGGADDSRLMAEQNHLLRDIRDELRRRRPATASGNVFA